MVRAGMPVQGDAREQGDARGCLTGTAGSRGMSPTAPLAVACPLPPGACAPLPAGAPGWGPCAAPSMPAEAASGARCHTPKQQLLSAVFLPFVCVFLILSPRKRDQLQQ